MPPPRVIAPCSPRVIALLDLDCFYCQCEMLRLGLPASTPLVVLQWQMSLAVSYPARELGIKRGDKYKDIKHLAQVVFIHVECDGLAGDGLAGDGAGDGLAGDGVGPAPMDRVARYERQYSLTAPEKAAALAREDRYLPPHATSKATIERYRYVSGLVFAQVKACLDELCGPSPYIFEKASVDEMYLDLSAHCAAELQRDPSPPLSPGAARTLPAGSPPPPPWVAGCNAVAAVRASVKEELGLTLSAGVAGNKTLAKLLAGENKPDGQCALGAGGLPLLLAKTKLGKVRGYGGKWGRAVIDVALAYRGVEVGGMGYEEAREARGKVAMADVAKVPAAFFEERRVSAGGILALCRDGEESEEVENTEGQLVQTISAFKSFAASAASTLDAIGDWVALIAREISGRVRDDEERNSRFPRTLTVYFASAEKGAKMKSRSGPMPAKAETAGIVAFFNKVLGEPGVFPLNRIGAAATNFLSREKNGIAAAFAKQQAPSPAKQQARTPSPAKQQAQEQAAPEEDPDLAMARRLQEEFDKGGAPDEEDPDLALARRIQTEINEGEKRGAQSRDRDEEVARELNRKFEREEMVLQASKKPQAKKRKGGGEMGGIQAFFQKKK